MLTKPLQDQILDLVRHKPRTVHEIAQTLQKNWRTANRYIEEIAQEGGLINTRTFREGSRGALKVVYWNALDHAKGSAYQERLLQKILASKHKEDFSPFDIYQFVDETKRQAFLETSEISVHTPIQFEVLLQRARQQILFFSGNMSWTELHPTVFEHVEALAKQKVKIKILTKVDITSQHYSQKLLDLNLRYGADTIEIRHCEQPIRGMVIDNEVASLKEVFSPQLYREKEIKGKQFIFYLVQDPEWIGWLQKVFWHLWGQSIDAKERLEAINSILHP